MEHLKRVQMLIEPRQHAALAKIAENEGQESRRILGVLDGQLGRNRWLAGDDYSIADIATFPWTTSALRV